MNKQKAKAEAENNTRTVGELLAIVDAADLTGMSKLNKGLTRVQAAQIFKGMLAGRSADEVPKGTRWDVSRNSMRMSGDGLGIQNLLREFA